TNNITSQTNAAGIVNNINLAANTGGNNTSYNTGGNSSIATGDANIIANLVNFVNNNVTGGGKLVVTVVNVFGSWLGNFVTPGHTDTSPVVADNPTTTQNSNSNENSNSNNSNSTNSSSSTTPNPQ